MTSSTTHTVAQSAVAMNEVRRSCRDDMEFSLFLCAVERHYGTEHMKAAWAQALELYEAERSPMKRIVYTSGVIGAFMAHKGNRCSYYHDSNIQFAYRYF